MKSNVRILTLGACLVASSGAHAAPVLIPNGDFSSPGGSDFGFFESTGGVVSFPTTGGNTNGYGLVDNTVPGASWGGGLVSPPDNSYPDNQGIPLATLGLSAGNTYTFSMDMKNFAGTGTGGLKLEAWNGAPGAASNTGDMPASGSSGSWATYSWDWTIPAGTTSIKIVPLLTGASGGSTADSVGFDNIRVDNTPITPPAVVPVIPNGGFETPGGANWAYFTDGMGLSWETTGGNPGGNAVINATTGGNYGVLVANNNVPQTLASLGLTAGETYTFQLDMKVLSGSNPGGLKVEFVPSASGDLRYDAGQIAALPNAITEWNTYSFDVTIPPSCTQIQVVPLWGPGSIVAYDNIKILLPVPPGNPQPSIALGRMVSWTPTVTANSYQPQESPDNVNWTNLGPAYSGTAVSSVFDSTTSAFYQVLESVPATEEATINGGFEDLFFDEPDGWVLTQSQPPTVSTDARTGNSSLDIHVVNAETGAGANGSEVQQNIFGAGGSITPGKTYDFSFWAKQVSAGPSYVQRFRVVWLAPGGGELGSGGFQDFSGSIGVWEQKTQTGLVAPAGTESALIQILGVTGAVDGGFGQVLIDDVSLVTTGIGSSAPIAASSDSAAEISWQSVTGQSYQLRSSTDLSDWSPIGGTITGDNTLKAVYDSPLVTRKFYQLGTE
ncbi:MAG: carbohydrate binding domain-containing protein [Luteolibacter sp.]